MLRLPTLLIAAVVAIALGAPIAQSQTEQAPPAGQSQPAPKAKKGLTAEEKAKLKDERAAKKDERAAKKKAREDKKAAKAAKKAKREECRTQAKQNNLKGKKLREFVQTCTGA
jgi:hypothetical protein